MKFIAILFSDMHIVNMFPTNPTSLMLGRRLLSSGHSLTLFCPTDVNVRQAATIPAELKIAANNHGSIVETRSTVDSIASGDFVIFPLLDLLPHNDRPSFAQMCQDLFR